MSTSHADDESWLDTRPDAPTKEKGVAKHLWVVHMSHDPIAPQRGLAESFICMGGVEAGDLLKFSSQEAIKAAFLVHYRDQSEKRVAQWAGDAYRFAYKIQKGDLFVFPPKGEDVIHIGQVTGSYHFAGEDESLLAGDSASTRRVKWLAVVRRSEFERDALACFDSRHTVHSASGYRSEVLKVLSNHGVVTHE